MGTFAEVEEKKVKKETKPTPPVQETVQRDLSDVNGPEGGMLPGDVSQKIQSMRGSGQRLSDRQNQFYSQKFGRDMSDVHVHTDAASDTVSRSLNARAFTIGSDVFLSKGINPDSSSGRDAQTMTHELTHVVQQGGHASSGPLKLGAADTAQEHEAESTAQREFDPKLKEDEDSVQRLYAPSNTIQRGFWSDLGSAIGGAALNAIGLGDAMGDFMSGDKKVKAAIAKMPNDKKDQYYRVESSIKSYEKDIIPRTQKEIKNLQSQMSKTDDPSISQQYQDSISSKLDVLDGEHGLKVQLQGYLNDQLQMLKSVDATITKDDVNRYRSGKTKTFFSSIFSAIGGKVLGTFENDPEKKAAAEAKGRNSINNWFASKNKQSADEDSEEDQARKAEELKSKQKNLEDSIWNDVQNDAQLRGKYTKLLFKREIAMNHMKMIQESLQEGESEEDIKSSVLMLLRNKAGGNAGAAENQGSASVQTA